uniref:Uncharacterized protein n=1 Tax=Strigamia maritima TaxID=126957 RepID=T1J3U7_STRMM
MKIIDVIVTAINYAPSNSNIPLRRNLIFSCRKFPLDAVDVELHALIFYSPIAMFQLSTTR